MRALANLNLAVLFIFSVFFTQFSSVALAKPKTIEVPVVVNIMGSDTKFTAEEAKDMVKRMNKIFKQANIKLKLEKVNPSVSIGDGDGKLDLRERNKAREHGKQELASNCGGKGMKICMCDEPRKGEPDTVGYAGHYGRTVFVQPDKLAGPNEPDEKAKITAATAAHELVHAWTVCRPNRGHSTDPNDLMYHIIDGGTNLRASDITEIRKLLKNRQKKYQKKAAETDDLDIAEMGQETYEAGAWGVHFDSFEDVTVTAGDPYLFDPCDPTFRYADIEDVEIYWADPFIPTEPMNLAIMPGGVFPEVEAFDSFFDVFYDYDDLIPGPEYIIQIHVWRTVPAEPLQFTAELQDFAGAPLMPIDEVDLIYNEFLDYDPVVPEPFNHRIECNIPPDFFGPGSEVFNFPIKLSAQSRVILDERLPGLTLEDTTAEFDFAIEYASPTAQVAVKLTETAETDGARYILGSGFDPGSLVTVMLIPENEAIEDFETQVTADGEGNFIAYANPNIAGGLGDYEVYAVSDLEGGPGIASASALFSDAPLKADLDEDGDVDFCDLAIFSTMWCTGVPEE